MLADTPNTARLSIMYLPSLLSLYLFLCPILPSSFSVGHPLSRGYQRDLPFMGAAIDPQSGL